MKTDFIVLFNSFQEWRPVNKWVNNGIVPDSTLNCFSSEVHGLTVYSWGFTTSINKIICFLLSCICWSVRRSVIFTFFFQSNTAVRRVASKPAAVLDTFSKVCVSSIQRQHFQTTKVRLSMYFYIWLQLNKLVKFTQHTHLAVGTWKKNHRASSALFRAKLFPTSGKHVTRKLYYAN